MIACEGRPKKKEIKMKMEVEMETGAQCTRVVVEQKIHKYLRLRLLATNLFAFYSVDKYVWYVCVCVEIFMYLYIVYTDLKVCQMTSIFFVAAS